MIYGFKKYFFDDFWNRKISDILMFFIYNFWVIIWKIYIEVIFFWEDYDGIWILFFLEIDS